MDSYILAKIQAHFKGSKLVLLKKGEVLTHAHEDPAGVTLLQNGTIEQYDITPEGNKLTVNIFKPPAFFPLSWAINRTPNIYCFSALTDATLMRADAEDTMRFLKQNPDVLFDVLSRVYKGTDALLKRLVLSSSGIALKRLIFELLIEAYRFGQPTDNDKVFVSVKQASLAARSGLARETVSRELHKLEKQELLTFQADGICLDTARLEVHLDLDI